MHRAHAPSSRLPARAAWSILAGLGFAALAALVEGGEQPLDAPAGGESPGAHLSGVPEVVDPHPPSRPYRQLREHRPSRERPLVEPSQKPILFGAVQGAPESRVGKVGQLIQGTRHAGLRPTLRTLTDARTCPPWPGTTTTVQTPEYGTDSLTGDCL